MMTLVLTLGLRHPNKRPRRRYCQLSHSLCTRHRNIRYEARGYLSIFRVLMGSDFVEPDLHFSSLVDGQFHYQSLHESRRAAGSKMSQMAEQRASR